MTNEHEDADRATIMALIAWLGDAGRRIPLGQRSEAAAALQRMLAAIPPSTAVVDNRRCKKCASIRGGDTCWKCGGPTFFPDPRCCEPRLPPIDRIRELAKEVGYAIGVHGSQQRDFDVIAAPWTDSAIGNHALLQHIAAGLTTDNGPARIISTERKPLGRYAATIQMDGWYKQLDISVCPTSPATTPAPNLPHARYYHVDGFQCGALYVEFYEGVNIGWSVFKGRKRGTSLYTRAQADGYVRSGAWRRG